MPLVRNKTKSAQLSTKKLSSTLVCLTFLLLAVVKGEYYFRTTRYWTLNNPSIKNRWGHSGSFDSSVIRYQRSISGYSRRDRGSTSIEHGRPIINLKMTNARNSLLDKLQVIHAECDISKSYKSKWQVNVTLFPCYSATINTLSAYSTSSSWYNFREMYLEIPGVSNFTGPDCLSKGFILKSSRSVQYPDFVFDYSTPSRRLDRSGSWGYDSSEFPFPAIAVVFGLQLLVLCLMSLVKDKRRLPMYSLYILAIGYFPIFAIIQRGTFAQSDSGFYSLYPMYAISLVVALIGIFCRKSRKTEKFWWIGMLMVFAAAGLFISTTMLSMQRFQLAFLLGPLALIVEKITRTKHRYLSFATLTLLVSQAALYFLVLNDQGAIDAAMQKIYPNHNYFPNEMYGVLAFTTMIVCFFGPHVKTSQDWKEGEEEKDTTNQLAEDPVDPFSGGDYVTAPSLDNSFAAPEEVPTHGGHYPVSNKAFAIYQHQPQGHQAGQVTVGLRNEYKPARAGQAQGGWNTAIAERGVVYEPF